MRISGRSIAGAGLALLFSVGVSAQFVPQPQPADFELAQSDPKGTVVYGDLRFHVLLTAPFGPNDGTMSFALDGKALSYREYESTYFIEFPLSQPLGPARTFRNFARVRRVDIGAHTLSATMGEPNYIIGPTRTRNLAFTVAPEFNFANPQGAGSISAFAAGFGRITDFKFPWQCSVRSVVPMRGASIPGAPTAALDFAYGFAQFDLSSCLTTYGTFEPMPSHEQVNAAQQSLRFEFPADIPAGSTVWLQPRFNDGSRGSWRQVSATIAGRVVGVDVIGAVGEESARGTLGVALPTASFAGQDVQGLWWGGNAENGWGLNISQSGDHLFAVLFTYDGDGRPAWYVMPSGQWDAGRFNFTGALYRPTGSPRGAYDAGRFQAGASVGNATLSFTSSNAGTLQYSIYGASGTKPVSKLAFGFPGVPTSNLTGIWWGGPSQAGWGVTMVEQGGFLFAAWYSYDTSGSVTWLFAPAMARNANGSYTGGLFRTTGAAWAGTSYDASRLKVTPAGTVTITPAGSGATMAFTVDGAAGSEALFRYPF